MKRLILLFSILNLFQLQLLSQNLIVNPDFEQIDSSKLIPSTNDVFSDYGIRGWFNPTQATPDCFVKGSSMLYNSSSEMLIDDLNPYSGNVFAGFFPLANFHEEPREYIGGSLIQQLDSGIVYKFTLHIAMRSSNSNYRIDTLGFYFTKTPLLVNTGSIIKGVNPQMKICIKNICIHPDSWEEITGYFRAKGHEKFFVIGNFNLPPREIPYVITPYGSKPTVSYNIIKRTLLESYYFIDSVSLTVSSEKEMKAALNKISPGQKLIKDNIHFKTGDSTLIADSYPILDAVILQLKDQPKIKVEIDGHTDSLGTAVNNQKLSEARARVVCRYFVSQGIEKNRITTKGFGSSRPICNDPAKNRRVEFIFSL